MFWSASSGPMAVLLGDGGGVVVLSGVITVLACA